MNRIIPITTTMLLLIAYTATAQQAFVLKLPSGNMIGSVLMPNGDVISLKSITLIEMPPPTPIVKWKTEVPRVVIVDDENLRGNLPQSQINIFTSPKLRDWMAENQIQYRFSSNDSLLPDSEARQLEKPVWVAGWDLVVDSVADGAIELPAMIFGDEKKTKIIELPDSVDSMIETLGAIQ